ncbi:hypothetical protein E4U09_003192 [Claviceps aff. purpurea]|uniref:Ubiquitin-activating enzyme E1-like n=1 Tax=Claviceps aff. purpurea TaxID=1967640 RepID=A0A9P7QMM8_9HYPO|nr:hypothetical protein E4U09_003192 [Claviceps aff. purpurea]
MDAPSEGVSHDAAPARAAPAESASTASSAGPAAAVNSVAGQTPNNFPFRTIEHELRPREPSQSSQVGHSQNGQPSVPNQSPMQPNPEQQDPAAQQRRRFMERDRHNHQSLGPSLNSAVKQARVLMVGAGGIGCELLKNLVLTGFGEVHIVDLDTIDLSNLNRQFLFRQEHIKKSKALVAKEAASKFNPHVKIVAHHANIKDDEFTVSWFKQFSIVFNALDNLDARRHVNKMCLAADVSLIESGTTGFNGQVQVIKKGTTACYDCTPKETPKSFPVCTIRSTPSQPIHCIVWGKSYLLNEVFGVSEDESAFDHSHDAENASEIEDLRRESAALKKIRDAVGTDEFPRMLFDKVYHSDIERLRSVEDLWKSRRRPDPLQYESLSAQATEAMASKDKILNDDQRIWTLEENFVVFKDSLDRLSRRMMELKRTKNPEQPDPAITFDKDDIDTLDFVASSANIRSTMFGIDRKSRFDIKEMAGNIIPAIATTNAIVAGLCVLEAFKVLKGEYGQVKEVFLTPFGAARLLAPDTSRLPNPDCPVCGVANVSVTVDLSRATLNDVVEDIVKEYLGFGDREFVLSNAVGIMYDYDETENLPKKLSSLGIKGGSFLTVVDEDDEEPFVNVVINIEESTMDEQGKPVQPSTEESPKIPKKPRRTAASNDETDDVQQSEPTQPRHNKGSLKRAHSEEDTPLAKKAKLTTEDDEDIVLVQDNVGAIVIDDD